MNRLLDADNWSPAWAWLILVIFVVVYVVVFDLHAFLVHGETMTGQMRDWIYDQVTGPFIVGGWIAVFAGLMWHFLVRNKD
jgi:amino acid transporter